MAKNKILQWSSFHRLPESIHPRRVWFRNLFIRHPLPRVPKTISLGIIQTNYLANLPLKLTLPNPPAHNQWCWLGMYAQSWPNAYCSCSQIEIRRVRIFQWLKYDEDFKICYQAFWVPFHLKIGGNWTKTYM